MTKSLHTPITMDDPLPGGEPGDEIEVLKCMAESKVPPSAIPDPKERAEYEEFLKTWTGEDE